MAKSKATAKSSSKSAKPASRAPTVAGLRNQIDRLDRQLVALMNQRAKLSGKICHLKEATGQPAFDPAREEEVLARAAAFNKGPLSEAGVRAVFRELINSSRAISRPLRVAYLGPAYSYSHLAAMQRFGQGAEFIGVGSFAAVFEEVQRGQASFGVVPIENSTDGRITDTLEMFSRLAVRICGEVSLAVHHYLLGRCPRSDVQEVYSRPQALSQCRNWLAKHLPAARTVEVTSTSTAAQLAQDKPGAAAVASMQAGTHYGLDVLAERIEDQAANATRFAVIGDQAADRTGRDKSALMFELHPRSGALADGLAIFKRNRLNLTWIESFPPTQPDGGSLFFVELEGHQQDKRMARAIESLAHRCVRLVVLGSYAKTPTAE